MKYALFIYGKEDAQTPSDADNFKMTEAYGAYVGAMQKAGIILGGGD